MFSRNTIQDKHAMRLVLGLSRNESVFDITTAPAGWVALYELDDGSTTRVPVAAWVTIEQEKTYEKGTQNEHTRTRYQVLGLINVQETATLSLADRDGGGEFKGYEGPRH